MAEATGQEGSWLARLVRPVWYLGNNRLSQIGVMLATAAAVTLVTFFTTHFFGVDPGPYVGILAVLVLPAVFVFGLVLIPLGIWQRRRREVRAGRLPSVYPPVDVRDPRVRETLWFVVVMTGFNVALFLTATYRAVHHMETVAFCGTTCHQVMEPEHTAYLGAPHARVPCVECHIGPGAPWFVRSKISGSYQVLAVAFDLYPRPIPTPIESLRPSRDTCEQCHWPEKFVGDKLVVKTHFSDDEVPAETKTVLLMHTGGLDPLSGRPLGNHGVHLEPGAEIRYLAADPQRQQIPYVRYRRPDGTVTEYVSPGAGRAADSDALRLMDCMDCHNRPSHPFELPGPAVDRALAAGLIDRTLPYVKKQAVALLEADYASHAEAATGIRGALHKFYRERHPQVLEGRRAAVDAAAGALAAIHARNVFPHMKVGWATYPNNLGHDSFPGCFRCHDGKHRSADGRTISADCTSCHQLLALEEENPDILKLLAGE
jgi:hypothetical protein